MYRRGNQKTVIETRTVFSEVCPPTSLNRHIIEIGQSIVSLFVCVCVCVWLKRAIFQNLSPCLILKMGSRSPKSNQFLSLSQQYSCVGLVKIHPSIQEIGCRQAIFQQSEPSFENGVKVTKI